MAFFEGLAACNAAAGAARFLLDNGNMNGSTDRTDDVQRLLDEGVNRELADLGERWNAPRRGVARAVVHAFDLSRHAHRQPARAGPGRPGDCRRDTWRGVLQLGQPLDAVAGGAAGKRALG